MKYTIYVELDSKSPKVAKVMHEVLTKLQYIAQLVSGAKLDVKIEGNEPPSISNDLDI